MPDGERADEGRQQEDARRQYEPPRIAWEEPFLPETFSQCTRKNVSCQLRGSLRT